MGLGTYRPWNDNTVLCFRTVTTVFLSCLQPLCQINLVYRTLLQWIHNHCGHTQPPMVAEYNMHLTALDQHTMHFTLVALHTMCFTLAAMLMMVARRTSHLTTLAFGSLAHALTHIQHLHATHLSSVPQCNTLNKCFHVLIFGISMQSSLVPQCSHFVIFVHFY